MNNPTPTPPAARPVAKRANGLLAALALCTLLPSLAISSANVALPALAESFQAGLAQLQWIVLAYLLATTTLTVGAGRLGDLIGPRRLLLAGVAMFTGASALAALAPSLPLLIAARALQGLGAAAMMALTMAMVAAALPKARTGPAMGLLGTMSAAGTALGPSLGGMLVAGFGGPAVFAVNLPLGLLALALAWRCLPPDAAPHAGARLNPAGMLWLALGLAAYALGVTVHAGLLGVAALALLMLRRTEARAASPLLPWPRLREPVLRSALAMNALVSAVMMATLIVGPLHLGGALGLGAAALGAWMSVGPIAAAASGLPAGRLVERFGAGRMAQAGLAAVAFGCLLIATLPAPLGVAAYVGPLLIVTPGYALFQAANNTAVMAGAAATERGLLGGLLTLSRNLGLITGASAITAAFAAGGLGLSFGIATALVVLALVLGTQQRTRMVLVNMPPDTTS